MHCVKEQEQFGSAPGACFAVLGEQTEDQVVQTMPAGEIGAQGTGGRGLRLEMLHGPAVVVRSVEGRAPGEHLNEDSAEGIEVGAAVEIGRIRAVPLLRRGVDWGEHCLDGGAERGAVLLDGYDREAGNFGNP